MGQQEGSARMPMIVKLSVLAFIAILALPPYAHEPTRRRRRGRPPPRRRRPSRRSPLWRGSPIGRATPTARSTVAGRCPIRGRSRPPRRDRPSCHSKSATSSRSDFPVRSTPEAKGKTRCRPSTSAWISAANTPSNRMGPFQFPFSDSSRSKVGRSMIFGQDRGVVPHLHRAQRKHRRQNH